MDCIKFTPVKDFLTCALSSVFFVYITGLLSRDDIMLAILFLSVSNVITLLIIYWLRKIDGVGYCN